MLFVKRDAFKLSFFILSRCSFSLCRTFEYIMSLRLVSGSCFRRMYSRYDWIQFKNDTNALLHFILQLNYCEGFLHKTIWKLKKEEDIFIYMSITCNFKRHWSNVVFFNPYSSMYATLLRLWLNNNFLFELI